MFVQLFVLFFAILGFYNFYWKRRGLPPGPPPLPLIGNMLSVILRPPGFHCYKDWKKKYGNVYTHWLGEHPVVAVNDYKLIQETFIKDADTYAERVKFSDFFHMWKYGNWGVIWSDGDLWREQRRYAIHILRNFGMGKNIVQEKILLEIQTLIDDVNSDLGKGIIEHNISDHIDLAVGSVINSLVFGYRYRGEKAHEHYYVKKIVADHIALYGHPIVMLMWKHIGWMKNLPYFSKLCKQIEENRDILFNYFEEHINQHKEEINLDSADEPKDYVEAFLREQHKRELSDDTYHYFNRTQLINMCFDLWLAGQETTSLTTAWAIVYLILHPEVQEKMHKEFDEIVGSDRLIEESDKGKLKYTCAVANEIQRVANIISHNLLHKTSKDVIIDGHHIPEGTSIIPQMSVVMYDDEVFPEPEKFKPERFLDENGNLKKVDELIPFSVGKRQCLGEGLAKMEIYLLIANLCNQFEFYAIPGKEPTTKRRCGQTVGPYPFVCGIRKRQI